MEGLSALHHLDHWVSCAMDLWVHTTLESYIIEFVAEIHQAFSKSKQIFKERARGRLLRELPLWIKFLLVEEGIFSIPLVDMEA